jgi:hypothetical protein
LEEEHHTQYNQNYTLLDVVIRLNTSVLPTSSAEYKRYLEEVNKMEKDDLLVLYNKDTDNMSK